MFSFFAALLCRKFMIIIYYRYYFSSWWDFHVIISSGVTTTYSALAFLYKYNKFDTKSLGNFSIRGSSLNTPCLCPTQTPPLSSLQNCHAGIIDRATRHTLQGTWIDRPRNNQSDKRNYQLPIGKFPTTSHFSFSQSKVLCL